MDERQHGHVTPRLDGVKARCGGPALCSVCAAEEAAKLRENQSDRAMAKPEIVVACIGPDASKALDLSMSEYESFRGKLSEEERSAAYRFAYWLFRYSGIAQPVKEIDA